MINKNQLLRNLPSVDQLLKSPLIEGLIDKYPKYFVLKAIRATLDRIRVDILSGDISNIDRHMIIESINKVIQELSSLNLRSLINATGIVIHTNLGRAPLSKGVLENVVKIAEGYSNLEYDLDKGQRGKRYSHIHSLINDITGAEDCLVVNNNAAAVLLCLSAMAQGKEVIVSRGELVEIGGAFRIPDVMLQSGACLKEIGTTNKTHLYDYENAISEHTGLILKVHQSNYRISGFTEDVSVDELVDLGKRYSLPVMYDLGSGCLMDLRPLGVSDEPTVQEVVRSGADLTTFSGDKLLGGPQGGIIVGRAELIKVIQKHPLTRALRVDKFTLAALESTYMIYADMEKARKDIPVLRMLFASEESLKIRARRLATALKSANMPAEIRLRKDKSRAGGGSLPEIQFSTWTVSVVPEEISINTLEERLRKGNPPVIGRIQEDRFILDARTIKTSQIKTITTAMKEALGN